MMIANWLSIDDRNLFIVQATEICATCGLYYKSCMIVIYDHNQSTIIVPVL
jgi:hypothetical protein